MTQPSASTTPRPSDRATPGRSASPASRWYSHGWNRPLSWKLIFGITPRLPRWLLVPLRHVVSMVCFAVMRHEREAVRRNLARVTGRRGFAGLRLAYRLFHNYSRYLVAYTELHDVEPERFRDRLAGAEEADTAIRRVIDGGRGAIIVTMHIGHWDLGLKLLARYHTPVHVVMLSEEPAEVSRYADEARKLPFLKIHQVGGSALLAVELMKALDRGELVAIQIDRPAGQQVLPVDLFGAPALLPAGPVQLAMASGAPVLPVFVLQDDGDSFRLLTLPPMRFERARGDAAASAIDEAMRRMASVIESVVSRYPDQWFNFYDIWNGPAERPSPRSRGWVARLVDLLVRQHTSTLRLSVAVGLGVFIGVSPFYGLHTLLAIGLAWILRLNVPVTVLATQISNPFIAPFLITGSVWLGGAVESARLANPAAAGPWWSPANKEFYIAWLQGSLLLGGTLSLLLGGAVYVLLRLVRRPHED